jgi:alpha-glucoside transport system permease protein
MSSATVAPRTRARRGHRPDPSGPTMARRVRKQLTSRAASLVALTIAIMWTLPTLGLLVSSFRPSIKIRTSGWWTAFSPDDMEFTTKNYTDVLFGETGDLSQYFLNSLVITIPSVLFPIFFGAIAAYALSWMKWRGRDWAFIGIFALQVVPLQMCLIPLLEMFSSFGLEGTDRFVTVWLAHTMFALPLCIFLLHNFMAELPGELFEAARVDGADHSRIFRSIALPLIIPALASVGIFQFLWVWNDLLVGMVFAGGTPDTGPLTAALAELAGTRGTQWQRLTAGAFVSLIVPMAVFLSLQRYFIRGLLAGGLKG